MNGEIQLRFEYYIDEDFCGRRQKQLVHDLRWFKSASDLK